MADLALRSALTTIESAIKNQLLLAYGARLTPAPASVAALRSIVADSTSLRKDELAYVTAAGFTYQFSRASTAADDGSATIRPTDNPTAGRWLKTTSATATGYCGTVRVHAGAPNYKAIYEKSRAQRPSMHVLFDGAKWVPFSLTKGALYQFMPRFRIVCVAKTLRQDAEPLEGSDIAAESATDPGTHDMIGDVCVSLAGSNLGVTGVGYCEISETKPFVYDEKVQAFFEEVTVTVYATVHQPDTGLVTLGPLDTLQVQYGMGGGAAMDVNNYVSSGYTITFPYSGLTATPTAGTAKIGGTSVSSTPPAHTFPVNSDTYRDLQADGTFAYTAVANGQPAPDVHGGANALRVGVTVTDGSGIIWDSILAPFQRDNANTDIVPGAGVGVTSIAITPSSPTVAHGNTVQLTATATYATGYTQDISDVVTWTSATPAAATVDYTGLATGVAAGTSSITATLDTITSPAVTLTVT